MLGYSGAVNQGNAHEAATNAYRIKPIASTHSPSVRDTWMHSSRIRNASTSMSNRAPNSEAVPVRRATWPSKPSIARATATSPTSHHSG